MTKRISITVAVVTVAIACSFFVTGLLIQKSYYDNIAKMNTKENIKVNLLSYERGFLHSTVNLSVEIGTENPNDMQVFALKQVITHGPIVVANTQNGPRLKLLAAQIVTSLSDAWAKLLAESTNQNNPLAITTLVNFNHDATTWLRLAAVEQTTPTEFHLGMDTINGLIEHDLSFGYYHGYITVPSIQINNPSWDFKVKNLVVNLDANKKEAEYASSNTLTTETLTYAKSGQEVVKLDGISAKLAFANKDNNLGLDLEASIANSQILDQHFQNDIIKLQADNLNRATLANLPRITAVSAKGTVDMLQDLTVASSNVVMELPKHFTEALISYVSFEIYKTSYLGRFDPRPTKMVMADISGSINKLMQGAVQQQLFLDKGTYYALNFNRSSQG